jgi:hypothetical protein
MDHERTRECQGPTPLPGDLQIQKVCTGLANKPERGLPLAAIASKCSTSTMATYSPHISEVCGLERGPNSLLGPPQCTLVYCSRPRSREQMGKLFSLGARADTQFSAQQCSVCWWGPYPEVVVKLLGRSQKTELTHGIWRSTNSLAKG